MRGQRLPDTDKHALKIKSHDKTTSICCNSGCLSIYWVSHCICSINLKFHQDTRINNMKGMKINNIAIHII